MSNRLILICYILVLDKRYQNQRLPYQKNVPFKDHTYIYAHNSTKDSMTGFVLFWIFYFFGFLDAIQDKQSKDY